MTLNGILWRRCALFFSVLILFSACGNKEKSEADKVFSTMDEVLKEKGKPLTRNPKDFEKKVEFTKPNDMIVAVIKNPTASAEDFKATNLTRANAHLFSEETYKTFSFVQKSFTVNNEFDHKRFHEVYLRACAIYRLLD